MINDDIRWLIAMITDTGMRLSEVAGLLQVDICEDEAGDLFVRVRPHPWCRLKTKGSERFVPLEGEARWAALQVLSQTDQSLFALSALQQHGYNQRQLSQCCAKQMVEGTRPRTMHHVQFQTCHEG